MSASVADMGGFSRCAFLYKVHDSAIWRGLARATLNGSCQQSLEFYEVDQLRPHLLQMMLRDFQHLTAASLTWTSERNDRSNFLWREAEVAGTPNESKRANMLFVINAVPALGPLWRSQDANVLEIANCFDVDAGTAGQLAPSDPLRCCTGHDDYP